MQELTEDQKDQIVQAAIYACKWTGRQILTQAVELQRLKDTIEKITGKEIEEYT